MAELMNEQVLRTRFDGHSVHHILAIWKRLCNRVGECIENGVVRVGCSEVNVPFCQFEKATLVQLLSEGEHMTDGNDYLFLIISDIIQRYNAFVGKIEELIGAGRGVPLKVIHPKLFSSLCGASALLDCPSETISQSLIWIAEYSWAESSQGFDLEQASQLGRLFVNPRVNLIGNPVNLLRETFCFRKEEQVTSKVENTSSEISAVSGVYFANHQDFELVDEIRCLLNVRGLAQGSPILLPTLNLKFRGLDYKELRTFLEGCRSVLVLWSERSDHSQQQLPSIETMLNPPSGSNEDCTSRTVRDIGMPFLSATQEKLLLSLDVLGVVELIKFLSYQLGSESHHFSSLPHRLSDYLADDAEQHLMDSFESQKSKTPSELLSEIDDFVENVLSYYEALIVEASSQKNWNLREFLSHNNFCDGSDPIFSLLPKGCTLRNYVHLRQIFHQQKLSLLVACAKQRDESRKTNGDLSFYDDPTKGVHWLWTEDGESRCKGRLLSGEGDYERSWRLWFEDVLPQPPAEEQVDTAVGVSGPRNEGEAEFTMTLEETIEEVEVVALDGKDEEDDSCMHGSMLVEPLAKNPVDSITPVTSAETIEDDVASPQDAAFRIQRWWRRELVALDGMSWATGQDHSFATDYDSVVSQQQNSATSPSNQEHIQAANSIHAFNGEFSLDFDCEEEVQPVEEPKGHGSSFVVTPMSALDSQHEESPGQQDTADLNLTRTFSDSHHAAIEDAAEQHNTVDDWNPTMHDTEQLREWLAANRLPASTLDALEKVGVRCLEHLQMVVQEYPDLLSCFKPLDQMKLKRGFS